LRREVLAPEGWRDECQQDDREEQEPTGSHVDQKRSAALRPQRKRDAQPA
jgi:hypothetical protein